MSVRHQCPGCNHRGNAAPFGPSPQGVKCWVCLPRAGSQEDPWIQGAPHLNPGVPLDFIISLLSWVPEAGTVPNLTPCNLDWEKQETGDGKRSRATGNKL